MEARISDNSLPIMPTQSWILEAMLAGKSNGKIVSTEELDYAYDCDWHVSGIFFFLSCRKSHIINDYIFI